MTSPFDAVSWLREFERFGGEVSLTLAGHLSTTRRLIGMTTEQRERSRALQMELCDNQSKLVAVWALMQRQRAA